MAMVVITVETAAERDLLARRMDALRHVLGSRTKIEVRDPQGRRLERLEAAPEHRVLELDRSLRQFLLMHPAA